MISLEKLKIELNSRIINPNFEDLREIIDWYETIEIQNIKDHFGFEDNSYCRIPLIAREEYDLLLCCWKPGQESPYHGHPDQGCLVKIIAGELFEEVRYNNGNIETYSNTNGGVRYINDNIGIHAVKNVSENIAVSLHLYAPGGYKPEYKTI